MRVVALDLCNPQSADTLDSLLHQQDITVELLINNAGYVKTAKFNELDRDSIHQMIDLNGKAMMDMTSLCLPCMHQGSSIIFVSSVSCFSPIMTLSVYGATKSMISYFATALMEELKPRGIHVFLFLPGNMDTEMNHKDKLVADKCKVSLLPYLHIEKETRKVIRKAMKHSGSYTPNIVYKAYRLAGKLLPHRLLVKVIKEN